LLFPLQVNAAWDFTSDSVQVTDATPLALPDADWTICFRFKLDSNTGTISSTLVANVSAAGNHGFLFRIRQATAATDPNGLRFSVEDSIGDNYGGNDVLGTGTPGTSTAWQTLCAVRVTSTLTVYVNNAQEGTATNANVDGIDPAINVYFGQESDADNFLLDGHLADFAIWSRALGASELASYEKFAANCFPGRQVYIPMVREYIEVNAGLTVTNTNTTASSHPPIINCS